jgi:hypothetical protein
MRHYSFLLFVIGAGGLCTQGYGEVVVEEPRYTRHIDYEVSGDSQITIFNPIDERGPYDFYCHYSGDPPYDLAPVQRVYAAPGVGNVEIKVTASDVWTIQILQTPPASGRIVELIVAGDLGHEGDDPALVANSAETLQIQRPYWAPAAGNILKPLDIRGSVSSLSVAGGIRAGATVSIAGDVGQLSLGSDVDEQIRIVEGSPGTGNLGYVQINGCLAACLHTDGDVDNVNINMLAGTLDVGGNLGYPDDPDGVLIPYLHPHSLIEVTHSIIGPVTFSEFMCGEVHVHENVLARVEAVLRDSLGEVVSTSDITGRIAVDGDLDSSIYTAGGLLHVGGAEPENGGQIVIGGAMTANGSIEIGGEVSDGIFVNRGFAPGATVTIGGPLAEEALFVVNADGADPGCDTWDGSLTIGGESSGPDQDNLWELGCTKGDANGDGALNTFDIDAWVLLLTNRVAYCATYPGVCGATGSSTNPPGGSYVYTGDTNCDGVVNTFDIDPFVLRLTNPTVYFDQDHYPPSCEVLETELGVRYVAGECCQACGALDSMSAAEGAAGEGMSGDSDDPGDVAGLIVENVSAELRPALLSIATQMAAELSDPDRAALWAEVAAELTGE